jgi:hypothetical protein
MHATILYRTLLHGALCEPGANLQLGPEGVGWGGGGGLNANTFKLLFQDPIRGNQIWLQVFG